MCRGCHHGEKGRHYRACKSWRSKRPCWPSRGGRPPRRAAGFQWASRRPWRRPPPLPTPSPLFSALEAMTVEFHTQMRVGYSGSEYDPIYIFKRLWLVIKDLILLRNMIAGVENNYYYFIYFYPFEDKKLNVYFNFFFRQIWQVLVAKRGSIIIIASSDTWTQDIWKSHTHLLLWDQYWWVINPLAYILHYLYMGLLIIY